MATQFSVTPNKIIVNMDQDTAFIVPGQNITPTLGAEYMICDNLSKASANNPLTITAIVSSPNNLQSMAMTSPGGQLRLTWVGQFYVLG